MQWCASTRLLQMVFVSTVTILSLVFTVFLYGGHLLLGVRFQYIISFNGDRPIPYLYTLAQKSFVLTMSYGRVDQQTVAACSIFSQMCWLRSFDQGYNTVIVEPFSNMSHFEHSPKYWTAVERNLSVMRFSDYFDLDHFQQTACRNRKSTDLVKWETFLHSAPRDVIAITVENASGDNYKCFSKIGRPDLACKSGPRHQTQIDYFTSGCETTEIDEAMNYLKHHGFRVVKHVCLNCEHGLPSTGYSPDDIMDMISGGVKLLNKTVLINTWSYAFNLVKKCQFHKYCSDCVHFDSQEYRKLMPSKRLKKDADRYLKDVLNATSISVAIMIRTERMFHQLKTASKVLSAMDSVLKIYKEILTKLSRSDNGMHTSKPLITIDIGKFGSDTNSTLCRECSNYTEIVAKFEQLLSHVYGKKWTLQHYENGLIYAVRGLMDGGYIAGVQRVLASEAKCLILYGGGHYQALAKYHYLLKHPNKYDQCVQYHHK